MNRRCLFVSLVVFLLVVMGAVAESGAQAVPSDGSVAVVASGLHQGGQAAIGYGLMLRSSSAQDVVNVAASKPVRIITVADYKPGQTAGSGTFTASGGIADRGTFSVKASRSKTSWLFVGGRGTIKAQDDANGRWIITRGTKAYARLTGKGTQVYPTYTPRFRMVWNGTVTYR